ncbi:hypothetical protein [Mucisphaera sp.]|uniref:hypothetical protein n=1 Tax=Mucisphaera sp. TaxID=2913024 RepID=UPI003D139485
MNVTPSDNPNPASSAEASAPAVGVPGEGAGPVWDNDRELVFVKRGQRHVFRCEPGEESALLNQLAVVVDDPGNNLDWFDAAVLSHHMGLRLRQRMQGLSGS